MAENIEILKIIVVGIIVVASVMYRKKTWGTYGFYMSIRLNYIIFLSFATGLIITGFAGVMPLPWMNKFAAIPLALSVPTAFIAFNFVRRNDFDLFKTIIIGMVWAFASQILLNSGNPALQLATLATFILAGSFALGVINGVLGPILPALTIAQFVTYLFWKWSPGTITSPQILEWGAAFADFGVGYLPGWVKLAGSALLVVLGLSDAFGFYGLMAWLQRIMGDD